MHHKLHLSVIIPSYNEERNLKLGVLEPVYDYLARHFSGKFELILVDDGSEDNTPQVLRDFSRDKPEVRVIEATHKGKGPTVAKGMLSAKGKHRLFTDLDQSTPITEIEKLLPFTSKGYDVVIGSREVKGAMRDKEPWYRHLMGRGFNFLVWILAVSGIHDTQCGFKLFSAKATQDLFSRLKVCTREHTISHPFTGAFDVELLFLAQKFNYSVAEVPVKWKHVETLRVSPIKDSLRMLLEVIRIRLTSIRGLYD